MTITNISTNVQTLLEDLDWLVTVLPHPPEKDDQFAGYPSVAHYYSSTENNYATVSQNRRVIEYIVELYLVTPMTTEPADEFSQMYNHADNLIQMFDESIDLSSTSLGLPKACDIMRPVPGSLERITTNEGTGLMMTIRLVCEADVNFR